MDAKEKERVIEGWKNIVGTVLYFFTKLKNEGKLDMIDGEDKKATVDRFVELIAIEIAKIAENEID